MQSGYVGAAAAAEVAVVVSVVEAVERDLALLERRKAGVSETTEAATALALARELDSHSSATSKSMCAQRLNETMAILREMAPEDAEASAVDELRAKREKRRAAR